MEELSLSWIGQQELQEIRHQLSDVQVYNGVAIELDLDLFLGWDLMGCENLKPTFKRISLSRPVFGGEIKHLEPLITTFAQSRAYPKSSSFAIAVLVTGRAGPSVDTLKTNWFGSVDIIEDIIKPFLPQSAPHLINIPKLFFIGSHHVPVRHHTKLPPFPDDPDSNYCVALYSQTSSEHEVYTWFEHITKHLLSGLPVQEVIEKSRHLIDLHGHLHYFSRLKDKQLTLMSQRAADQ